MLGKMVAREKSKVDEYDYAVDYYDDFDKVDDNGESDR